MSKMIDMTGWVVGDWDVLERAENTKRGEARWKCRCRLCGTEKVVTGTNLRGGQSKSCGCQKMQKMRTACVIDETDKIYGFLHVLREATPEEKASKTNNINTSGAYWVCECLKCGNPYTIVKGDYLRNGDTKSCGCLNSYNESKIEQLLYKNNIQYKKQYTFSGLTSTGRNCDKLMFDFAILNESNKLLYLIEYDGEQHFLCDHAWNKKQYKVTIQNDTLKNNYCFKHNIPLIRIPYSVNNYTINDLKLETTKYLLTLENIQEYYKNRESLS